MPGSAASLETTRALGRVESHPPGGRATAPGSAAAALFEPCALRATIARGRDAQHNVQKVSSQAAAGRVWMLAQLGRWLKRGRLKYREEVSQGLESAPQAFIGMLLGQSMGKQLVQLS